jgi:hypothetical protein
VTDEFNPLISAALDRIDEAIGRPVACPLCGETEWEVLDVARFLRLWAPSEKVDAELDDPSADVPLETWRIVALSCTRCRFLRLHEVDEEFGESPEAV